MQELRDQLQAAFQSTLPVRGATLCRNGMLYCITVFQSTLPVRGATLFKLDFPQLRVVSIHAPRAGSDDAWPAHCAEQQRFNPRSPCGERPCA